MYLCDVPDRVVYVLWLRGITCDCLLIKDKNVFIGQDVQSTWIVILHCECECVFAENRWRAVRVCYKACVYVTRCKWYYKVFIYRVYMCVDSVMDTSLTVCMWSIVMEILYYMCVIKWCTLQCVERQKAKGSWYEKSFVCL